VAERAAHELYYWEPAPEVGSRVSFGVAIHRGCRKRVVANPNDSAFKRRWRPRHGKQPAALHSGADTSDQLFEDWFDPIESGVRERVRHFIESMIEAELEEAFLRPRYGRLAKTEDMPGEDLVGLRGHRHGHRSRSLAGTFGQVEISVPRARLKTPDGKTMSGRAVCCRPISGARRQPTR
jgi:hypothetical protein